MGFLRRRANKVSAAQAVPLEPLPTSASQARAELEKEKKKDSLLDGHPMLSQAVINFAVLVALALCYLILKKFL
ncbi:hypothetical protein FOZ61_008778 [Perkinsus olseni]|uniref:Uncharacterized protein n=1 Tax=Perkinsus olseni TaxID=32597 RepID=A0A7J6MY20_PEROL|nr:hypothetical protein FOZ61_008778 [Perkinsus olseni]KAF4676227.1 hypothetical protein FOL46_006236 [Perkinsus olseni]